MSRRLLTAKRHLYFSLSSWLMLVVLAGPGKCRGGVVRNYPGVNNVWISNGGVKMLVNYDKRCVVDELWIGNDMVLDKGEGAYTGIRTGNRWSTSRTLDSVPTATVSDTSVVISNIRYGKGQSSVDEKWIFSLRGDGIEWQIDRSMTDSVDVDDDAFPMINIASIDEFDGALLGNGGVAWFRLFNDSGEAYGIHTNLATFWNPRLLDCLQLASRTVGGHAAVKFFRAGRRLACSFSCSPNRLGYRYDPGTNRRRFVVGHTDVWETTTYHPGHYRQTLLITAPSYEEELGRGHFSGIDGNAVTSILNTVARLGVIDSRLYGGNSWHTPYGPICLHEQYIAQFGIGIDDKNYIDGYKKCLDYYRDHAVEPDGRVKARWAYTNEDAAPGTADSLGFYEAQWGILMDSNPDFVINVADLFNQCGDINWLRSQKETCERALDYMLRRDLEHDSLVEVFPRTHNDHRGSDWLDVIWASWKNAFVNVELYHALKLWSGMEDLMGDSTRASQYAGFAAGLKRHFNEPISRGGFWDPQHGWYVHWREPDGSVWGDNLVTPVNFMAIDYGICDNPVRKISILHEIDSEMQKENLFFWPICMFPYEPGAGGPQNYPFPNYENGDIFLSWGELAVRAYADVYPEVALRYIKRVIAKYRHDGLAFQRYLRISQKGAGDDILAGNASAIIGLYRDIYGIQPQHNRLYLAPHLVKELYGTTLRYWFEGAEYDVKLNGIENQISSGKITVGSFGTFALKQTPAGVLWFNNDNAKPSMKFKCENGEPVSVSILDWARRRLWTESAPESAAEVSNDVVDLERGKLYAVYLDGKMVKCGYADEKGGLQFSSTVQPGHPVLFEIRRTNTPPGVDPDKILSVSRPTIAPLDTVAIKPGQVHVRIGCETPRSVIRYTLNGSDPTETSERYTGPFTLISTTTVKARAWKSGRAASGIASAVVCFVTGDSTGVIRIGKKEILLHKGFGARVRLKYPFSPEYAGSGNDALTDGLLGSSDYQSNWQGFEKHDLDATIDMASLKVVDSVSIAFLQNIDLWIYYPVKVQIWVSADGIHFHPLSTSHEREKQFSDGSSERTYVVAAGDTKCRYIRVKGVNIGTCPAGNPGAGEKAWLFADEIVVR